MSDRRLVCVAQVHSQSAWSCSYRASTRVTSSSLSSAFSDEDCRDSDSEVADLAMAVNSRKMLLSSTGPSWTHHLVVAFQLFFESLRPVARLLAIFFFMVSSHYTPNLSANTWLTVLTFMVIRRTTFKDKVLSVLASFIIFLFFFFLPARAVGVDAPP